MSDYKKYSALAVGLLFILSACGGGGSSPATSPTASNDKKDFFVTVEPTTKVSAAIVTQFQTQRVTLAARLNAAFSLPDRDIKITFKDCGQINASYTPSTSQVDLCYELLADIIAFGSYSNEDALGIFSFIVWHELGHAFVDHYKLTTLGGEEDVVDAISAVINIGTATTPNEQILAAAYVILAGEYLNARSSTTFASVHTNGPQRLGNLICLAYGANAALATITGLQNIVNQFVLAGRDCPAEYATKLADTNTLLKDFIK